MSAEMTSLGLTRTELRSEVDEMIRNAYSEGWREAKRRPDPDPPALEIEWTTVRWCPDHRAVGCRFLAAHLSWVWREGDRSRAVR